MSIFLQNKYTKWYYDIVTQPDVDPTIYTENHHIIPAGMGGSDDRENMVRLSARQHFVAHLLLIKMTEGENRDKAISAIRQMQRSSKGQKRYVPNSRIFSIIRNYMAEQQRERAYKMWADPEFRIRWRAGVDKSNAKPGAKEKRKNAALKGIAKPETQIKRSAALEKRPKHTEETKQIMRESWEARNGIAKKYKPKSLLWKAVSPAGEVFEFESLLVFCQEQNLDKPTLSLCVKTGNAIPPMQRNRIDTSETRKNTIGWLLIKQR